MTVKVHVPLIAAAASSAGVGPFAAVEVVAPQLPQAPSNHATQINAVADRKRFTARDDSESGRLRDPSPKPRPSPRSAWMVPDVLAGRRRLRRQTPAPYW